MCGSPHIVPKRAKTEGNAKYPEHEKNPETLDFRALSRAGEQTRTADLLITNEVRYHLCHASTYFCPASLRQHEYYTIEGRACQQLIWRKNTFFDDMRQVILKSTFRSVFPQFGEQSFVFLFGQIAAERFLEIRTCDKGTK